MKSISVLVLTLAILLAACGGDGGDDDSPEETVSPTDESGEDFDRVRATAMLLSVEDLAEEWGSVDLGEGFPDYESCETADPADVVAETDTRGFSTDLGRTVITERIIFFADEDAAAAGIAEMPDREECIVDLFASGDSDNENATFSDAADESVESLDYGDGAAALRVSAVANATNPDAFVQEEPIYTDATYVVVGRVGVLIIAAGRFEPYDTSVYEDITAQAVEKVADDLGVVVIDPRSDRPEETAGPTDGEPSSTLEPTETPVPEDSRENTVPFGQPASVAGGLTARVLAANFDAEEIVLAENQFNEPAANDKVMVMITLEITNDGAAPLDTYFDPSYVLVGEQNSGVQDLRSVVRRHPRFPRSRPRARPDRHRQRLHATRRGGFRARARNQAIRREP